MKITVERFKSDKETTISKILIDDVFQCYGLEDEYRAVKVKGETRIPQGTYSLKVRNHGGFHAKFTTRFPNMHKGMIEVFGINNFTDVLIHTGNTDNDTMGCLLTCTDWRDVGGELVGLNSTAAYIKLYERIIDAVIAGTATITYLDNDGAKV